jgi:Tol biopolymer transport system component
MTKFALTLFFALAAVGASSAEAASLPTNSTVILSGTPSLLAPLPAPAATSRAFPGAVSQTGRLVAFESRSDGLSADDDDSVSNVYVKDRVTGAVILVSRRSGATGAPATQDCREGTISDDGRRVAFTCDGPLDPADTNGKSDVYLRDLIFDTTVLVSRASGADGAAGNLYSNSPALSEDGTVVAFVSNSTNLGGSSNISTQVYARAFPAPGQAGAPVTYLVSRASGLAGAVADADSDRPSISDNGLTIAFQSNADNLASDDTNRRSDVFVRQASGLVATTRLISRSAGPAGVPGDLDSKTPSISGDAKVVLFASAATNLVAPKDAATTSHIYERSLVSDGLLVVDQVGGVRGNGDAADPSSNDAGDAVSFKSAATNLDPADKGSGVDAFVARPGSVTLVSRANGAASSAANSSGYFGSASVSGDGGQVLFGTVGSVTGDAIPDVLTLSMRDLAAATTDSVSRPEAAGRFENQGGDTQAPVLSADGRYAAFVTSAPALGVPSDATEEVVVRDTVTGAMFVASRKDGPRGAVLPDAVSPSISANGRRVAFIADAGTSVYVRDLVTGSTTLASRANGRNGAAAGGFVAGTTISADGNRVEFVTTAANLGDGDTDAFRDVHVRDLAAGTTVLASRANGAAGATANDDIGSASLSADGAHVAFDTRATNLGDGATGARRQVHVRDLGKGTTRLASVSNGGTAANSDADQASIDADGTRVAFVSAATNLASTPLPPNSDQVWVRDLTRGSTILASRTDGPNGAPGTGSSDSPALSSNGAVVAFGSRAVNLAPGLPPFHEVFRRDLEAGSTRLVSRSLGANAVSNPRGAAVFGGITADGACVGFRAGGGLLRSVPGSGDYDQAYMRAFKADCGGRAITAFGTPNSATGPLLRSVSLTHKRFRVAKGRTALVAKKHHKRVARGTVLRFTSNKAAKLTVLIERVRPARKHGKRRNVTRAGTLTRTIKAGRGRVTLTGRLGKRRMPAGSYRLTVTARDAAGNVSKPVRLAFVIVAR